MNAWTMKLRHRRHERKMLQAFRNPPMPLLGLPEDWLGIRLIGGWGMSGKAVTQLELAHRPILDIESPELRVEVARGRHAIEDSREGVQFEIAGAIRRQAAKDSGRANLPEDDEELVPAADLVWGKVTISIEDASVPFEVTRWDRSWAAIGSWEDAVVTLRGTMFPAEDVKLAVIRDVEPYLEGSRQMQAWWRQQAEKNRDSG
jgi:hypothetical protein